MPNRPEMSNHPEMPNHPETPNHPEKKYRKSQQNEINRKQQPVISAGDKCKDVLQPLCLRLDSEELFFVQIPAVLDQPAYPHALLLKLV